MKSFKRSLGISVLSLVSIFALSHFSKADAADMKKVQARHGTIASVTEDDVAGVAGGKKLVVTLNGGETLVLYNSACLASPDKCPGACPLCAACYEKCREDLEAHIGDEANFLVLVEGGSKVIQGQFQGFGDGACDPNDDLCNLCQVPHPDTGEIVTIGVKCFTM